MVESTDEQLIQQTLSGDRSAFDQLARRHQDRLVHSLEHMFGSRDDALDVAQQALLLAWRKLSSFRREAGFYSWLYRIARNVAITRARRHRPPSVSLEQLHDAAGYQPPDRHSESSPEQPLQSSEEVQAVRDALAKISDEFRQPLVLKEIDGFSYDEIAAVLEIPLGTVRSRIFRARQELIEHLKRTMKDW